MSAAESECSSEALQLRQGFAGSALELLTQQGPATRALLDQLRQQLLRPLDGFVMPANLQGSSEDVRNAVTRLDSSGSVILVDSLCPPADTCLS